MTLEQEIIALELIQVMKEKGLYNTGQFWNTKYPKIDYVDAMVILSALKEMNILEQINTNQSTYRLTETVGKDFTTFEDHRKNKQTIKEIEELQHKKLKVDLDNAKRIYKTYWWTFVFALLGLLISLYLLFLKITGKPTP